MKFFAAILISSIATVFSACTSVCLDCGGFPGGPPPPPSAWHAYDNNKDGVQIGSVFYNPDSNAIFYKDSDEFILLTTDSLRITSGWSLGSGLTGQRFQLSDTISSQGLTVYSHETNPFGPTFQTGLHIPKGVWLWNKKPFDTAVLWNDKGVLIDSLIFSPH